ncbi:hypothetical protein, partial [Litoreibacter halocynthiae]|uniref:hypothetical protein n=1 Tax=Litoreibacter halocynthiae TaxID=1242689 RepID=UPI002492371F
HLQLGFIFSDTPNLHALAWPVVALGQLGPQGRWGIQRGFARLAALNPYCQMLRIGQIAAKRRQQPFGDA